VEQNLNLLKNCPLCGGEKSETFLTAKDHSFSKEDFKIESCLSCGFKFTNPIPSEDTIGNYYKSEIYISHNDSNKGLMNKVYKWVRKRAIRSKENIVSNLSSERKILDIGCGTGDFLAHCKEQGWTAKGLEPDPGARQKCSEKGIEVADIVKLHDTSFSKVNVISMWHVLEHVYHLKRDFKRMVELLEDNGSIVIAVPNHTSYDAKKYHNYWAAYDLPIHLYHFKPDDIKLLAKQHNLSLEKMIPMKWDAYYVSMLSESFKGRNKWRGLKTGFLSNMKAKNGEYSSQIYVLRKK
jgi:2-polyprenyl-3-methyl-5-hydroxy-6-metoxy-1,4-benzoquinol methylase